MKVLNEYEASIFLKENGINVVDVGLANTEAQALEIAKEIGYPVLLKNSDRKISDIDSDEKILKGCKILGTKNVLIKKQLLQGKEVYINLVKGQRPAILFGLRGIFSILNDTSYRTLPISKEDAKEMITEISAYEILKDCDLGAIADVIFKVSQIGMENEIKGMEIDLFSYEKGAVAVNAKIVMK